MRVSHPAAWLGWQLLRSSHRARRAVVSSDNSPGNTASQLRSPLMDTDRPLSPVMSGYWACRSVSRLTQTSRP
jgi:hypothetical protein